MAAMYHEEPCGLLIKPVRRLLHAHPCCLVLHVADQTGLSYAGGKLAGSRTGSVDGGIVAWTDLLAKQLFLPHERQKVPVLDPIGYVPNVCMHISHCTDVGMPEYCSCLPVASCKAFKQS